MEVFWVLQKKGYGKLRDIEEGWKTEPKMKSEGGHCVTEHRELKGPRCPRVVDKGGNGSQ